MSHPTAQRRYQPIATALFALSVTVGVALPALADATDTPQPEAAAPTTEVSQIALRPEKSGIERGGKDDRYEEEPATMRPRMSSISMSVGTILTDRPYIADTSYTVGPGVFQIEQGAQFDWASGAGTVSFPSLLRLGVLNHLEVRVESPIVALAGGNVTFNSVSAGAKWRFINQGASGSILPSMALQANANITPKGVEPIVKLLANHTLPWDLNLNTNLGASLPVGNTLPAVNAAVAFNRNFGNSFRLFAEAAGDYDFGGWLPKLGADAGVLFRLGQDWQLDAAVYKGLTANAPEWAVTTGISARFGAW